MRETNKHLPLIYACIFPGLGHLSIKESKKGSLILLGCLICLIIPYLGWILGLLIYGWSIADISNRSILDRNERRKTSLIIVIVIVILFGIIFGLFSYLAVHFLSASKNRNAQIYVEKQINEIISETIGFEKLNNRFPRNLVDMIGNSPLKKKYLKDYWGNEYHYEIVSRDISVTSPGKDKIINTDDDIMVRRKI